MLRLLCYDIALISYNVLLYSIGFIPSSISNPQYGVDGGMLYILQKKKYKKNLQ